MNQAHSNLKPTFKPSSTKQVMNQQYANAQQKLQSNYYRSLDQPLSDFGYKN